jgi:hypothetical protein
VDGGSVRLAWEDLLGGGDQDFDDAVLTIRLRQEAGSAVFTYQAQAMDPDGDPLTYALVDGPAGATIDAATGLLTWEAQAGTYQFVLQVTDGQGGVAEQRFRLTVQPTPILLAGGHDALPPCVDWGKAAAAGLGVHDLATPAWLRDFLLEFGAEDPNADLAVSIPGGDWGIDRKNRG